MAEIDRALFVTPDGRSALLESEPGAFYRAAFTQIDDYFEFSEG